jgi:hypothetical protein
METFLIEVAKVATAAATVCAVLGFLGSKLLEHWLGRLSQEHEDEIKKRSEESLIALRRQLDTDATKLIEEFRTRLTEESTLRIETFRNRQAADTARDLETLPALHLDECESSVGRPPDAEKFPVPAVLKNPRVRTFPLCYHKSL